MIKFWREFWDWFLCLIGDHDWTCAVDEGIEATPKQLESVDGFWDYAKTYCKRCGTVSRLSQ